MTNRRVAAQSAERYFNGIFDSKMRMWSLDVVAAEIPVGRSLKPCNFAAASYLHPKRLRRLIRREHIGRQPPASVLFAELRLTLRPQPFPRSERPP